MSLVRLIGFGMTLALLGLGALVVIGMLTPQALGGGVLDTLPSPTQVR